MSSALSNSRSASSSAGSSFIDPSQAQEHFSTLVNLDDPISAISSYTRIMRDHTQRQMDLAARAANRRSAEGVSSTSTLINQTSVSSTMSADSRGNV